MKHYFLDNDNFYDRILYYYNKEQENGNKLIVACDFDDTLYDCRNLGYDFSEMIELIKNISKYVYVIIFTARPENEYSFVEEYLNKNNIPFNSINEDAPWISQDRLSKKVYYHVLLDDKAGLSVAYNALNKLYTMLDNKEVSNGK